MYQNYKNITPIQLRFTDIDRLNHVNNASYLTFFELGRINYFNTVVKIDWIKTGFVIARIEIDYVQSILFTDEIYCFTKIIKMGTKSMTLKNTLAKKINNEFVNCANGIIILVAMDYTTKTTINVPEDWRQAIENFEK